MTQVDQHAGLHRVAALLGGDSPEAVFAAAVEELAQIVDHETGQGHSEIALIARYEDDRTFTVLESWGERGGRVPRSSRWPLEGRSAIVQVHETGAFARIDDDAGEPGVFAESARGEGIVSAVAVPISVDGALWGSASLHGRRRLPDAIEVRIAEFARLAGAAVANADVRLAAQRLAEEQAALRRVAGLVGGGVPPGERFAAGGQGGGRPLQADPGSP